jgi:restriction system protein
MAIPTFDQLFNPLLQALQELGGSASLSEMEAKVGSILNLSEEDSSVIHKGNTTEVNYRLAWARNYLKRYGLLENSSRGVWALTSEGKNTKKVDPTVVNKAVKNLSKLDTSASETKEEIEQPAEWQYKLLEELKKLSPEAFERLCQRLLRESGFVEVEVTGKSGDGGIDGRGTIRLHGLVGFRIIFQCKRYAGAVKSQEIREFKGTMVGRAEKGLFITTGTFTRDARQEAVRDGAPPIDLIDGEQLVQRLKELSLGVQVKNEELITLDEVWFKNF